MRSRIFRSCSDNPASGSLTVAWVRSRSMTRAVVRGSSSDPPLATVRTAPRMSAPRTCFSTYPAAPAMIASNSASSSANDVSIRHGRSGSSERNSRQTLTPSPSGSRTSRTATSGRTAGTRASASAAVDASPTTSMSPSDSSRSRTPRRTTSWSSSRNTRIGAASSGMPPLSAARPSRRQGPKSLRSRDVRRRRRVVSPYVTTAPWDEGGTTTEPTGSWRRKETTMRRKVFDALVSTGGLVLAAILLVAGGLLVWAHTFVDNNVHTQLSQQQIFFPDKAGIAAQSNADITKYVTSYAGQQVVNGKQAQVFANHYIQNHLKEVADGQTYSQVSGKFIAMKPTDPNYATVSGERQTLFMGETLRGLLPNSYGVWNTGQIAMCA